MKSRGIAAGATVIVLALAGAGPSAAVGLGDVAPTVSVETGVGAQANTQVAGIKTNAKLDTNQWTDSLDGKTHHGSDAAGSVKVKSHGTGTPSVGEQQSVHLGGSAGLAPSITRPGKLTAHAKARVDTRLKGGHAAVNGSSRHSARADVRGPKSTHVKSRAHGRSSVALSQKKGVRGLGGERLAPKSEGGHFLPFRGIGREVGNPLQLQLAGWLLVLTAGICLGLARMARRRGHRFN
jgi:hypothetical protein